LIKFFNLIKFFFVIFNKIKNYKKLLNKKISQFTG